MHPTARLTLAAALCVLALPANSGWVHHSQLFAHDDDAGVGFQFGRSVAISGDTIVVGASFADTTAENDGSADVFTRPGGIWSQQDHLLADEAAENDLFGSSVAVDGDTLVVGAQHATLFTAGRAASAYVFTRTGSTWSQQDHLFSDVVELGQSRMGVSVAIDGDTFVMGVPDDDTAAGMLTGSVYVFTRTGGTWGRQDLLFADDARRDDEFGYSVAISGDTIVVGARHDDYGAEIDAGSAYVFTRTGSTWSQQAHLFGGPGANAGDEFGYSAAISGDTIVVGAVLDSTVAANFVGSANVFTRTGGTWSRQARLFADDPAQWDRFGNSVAISGDTIVVGAVTDSAVPGIWAGSAYVFTRTGSTWSQQDLLFDDDAGAGDRFGHSVAISGDTIVVGAYGDDTVRGEDAGSAHVFWPAFFRIVVVEPELPSGH